MLPRATKRIHLDPQNLFVRWCAIWGIDAPLAERCWRALELSRDSSAERLVYFWTRQAQRPVDDPARAKHHVQQVGLGDWTRVLQGCVAKGTLTQAEASRVFDGVSRPTDFRGAWK